MVNNVIHGASSYGVQEVANAGCATVPRNNLFFGNAGGDYRDRNNDVWTGAVAINTSVPGASGNVDGNPLFMAGPSGTWTEDGVFDPVEYRTTFTDAGGSFAAGALVGKVLNPNTAQARLFSIVANTETTLTVEGNASPSTDIGTTNGQPYLVTDFHLQDGSPAVDRGSLAVVGLPATDIDGDLRPGPDGLVDIGADESPYGFLPPTDLRRR